MSSPGDRKTPPPEPLVPPGGLQIMALILVAMTLVTIYSNVQRNRPQLETITIAPVVVPSVPTPTPAAP